MLAAEQEYETPKTLEDGFNKVRDLIFYQVHKFIRSYGGDFDDLFGDAQELFVIGHNQYLSGATATGMPLKFDYATTIRFEVWYGLFDKMRVNLTHKRIVPCVPLEDYDIPVSQCEFDTEEFIDGLSKDARTVADLVLNPPEDIFDVILEKGGTPRNYRSTIRAHLKANGWSSARVDAAFDEIKTVLG